MDKQEYFNRVLTLSQQPSDSVAFNLFLKSFPTMEKTESLLEKLEAFGVDARLGYQGLIEFCSLPEALARFNTPSLNLNNWHYDRKAEVVLINCLRGSHESFSAKLLALYAPEKATQNPDMDSETFLHEGLGWFMSSSSLGYLQKSEAVSMTAQEKRVFNQWKIQNISP